MTDYLQDLYLLKYPPLSYAPVTLGPCSGALNVPLSSQYWLDPFYSTDKTNPSLWKTPSQTVGFETPQMRTGVGIKSGPPNLLVMPTMPDYQNIKSCTSAGTTLINQPPTSNFRLVVNAALDVQYREMDAYKKITNPKCLEQPSPHAWETFWIVFNFRFLKEPAVPNNPWGGKFMKRYNYIAFKPRGGPLSDFEVGITCHDVGQTFMFAAESSYYNTYKNAQPWNLHSNNRYTIQKIGNKLDVWVNGIQLIDGSTAFPASSKLITQSGPNDWAAAAKIGQEPGCSFADAPGPGNPGYGYLDADPGYVGFYSEDARIRITQVCYLPLDKDGKYAKKPAPYFPTWWP